jgi:hypothetical protein
VDGLGPGLGPVNGSPGPLVRHVCCSAVGVIFMHMCSMLLCVICLLHVYVCV